MAGGEKQLSRPMAVAVPLFDFTSKNLDHPRKEGYINHVGICENDSSFHIFSIVRLVNDS